MNATGDSKGQSPFSAPSTLSTEPAVAVPVDTQVEAEDISDGQPIPWQPFTLNGVAAFSNATLSRVLLVQIIISLWVGATVVWFVDKNYTPVIVEALHNIPEDTALRYGTLRGSDSGLLAEGQFLSLGIELEGDEDFGQSSDLQVELRKYNFQIYPSLLRSVAGVWEIGYPLDVASSLSPAVLEPWWGAWHPIFYTSILVGVAAALMLTWSILATVYMFPVRLIAYYADRQLTLSGAWHVSAVALMPGAVTMIAAIVFYSWQLLDLIGLAVFVALHLVVGWIYLLVAPCRVAKVIPDVPPPNPFVTSDGSEPVA